jgi:hypothetical protein
LHLTTDTIPGFLILFFSIIQLENNSNYLRLFEPSTWQSAANSPNMPWHGKNEYRYLPQYQTCLK